MMDKLLGQVNLTSLSFVDHKMLFSTHELKVLKIESRHTQERIGLKVFCQI